MIQQSHAVYPTRLSTVAYMLCLAVFALGLAACSDTPTEPEVPDPDEISVTVEGEVVDENTQDSIEGADVAVYGDDDDVALETTTTGADGVYELIFIVEEDDVPHDVRLEAEAEGYVDYETTLDFSETISYDIELEFDGTEATAFGVITDEETGEGIEDATVTGTDTGDELFETTTDMDGEYEVSFVVGDEPAEVIVRAEAEGYKPAEAAMSFSEDINVDLALDEQQFAGGLGTEEDPYQIETVEHLQTIDDELDAHFVQIADIDASETTQWDGGNGFDPIGHFEAEVPIDDPAHIPFTGSFDGGGYEIAGLAIDRTDRVGLGLFALVEEAQIENVTVTDVTIVGVGGVGGVVGVAFNDSEIRDAHVTGEVAGEFSVGGLVGGSLSAEIHESSADVTVESDDGIAGGLLGEDLESTRIYASHAEGNVESTGDDVGGLVGSTGEDADIRDSYATGNVQSTGNNTGGLVGLLRTNSQIHDSHATGDVESSSRNVGGLVGAAGENVEIHDSYAIGEVTGDRQVGGLVGQTEDGTEIRDAYATGNVSGDQDTGGLIGATNGTAIRNAYAEGDVSADGRHSGGLIGWSNSGSDVRTSYAEGDVSARIEQVGGLIGRHQGSSTVRDSYARGAATGDSQVGGLIGRNMENSSIIETYATGAVDSEFDTGGLIGVSDGGSAINSYWDTESTGETNGVGGGLSNGTEGLTTDEMTGSDAEDNMSGFDFDDIWRLTAGEYPMLWWQD